MSSQPPTSWSLFVRGLVALLVFVGTGAGVVWLLSRVLTGTVGGAVAGGLVGLAVSLISKQFERQKQHETAIAEKKREVYRRLLTPWEQAMVAIKNGKEGQDLLANVDMAAMYASTFDAVLYGSKEVVTRYVRFRSPDPNRDGIDMLRDLAALLIAMREDVTSKKADLAHDAVLATFMNLSEEERALVRLREYVEANPAAQRKLAEAMKSTGSQPRSDDERHAAS